MKTFKKMEFNLIPIGTKLYKMYKGQLVEFCIVESHIKLNTLEENFIKYTARTGAWSGSFYFIQPLDGKFKNATNINGYAHINTLFETKEECVNAFLEELGVKVEAKIKVE